jgi:hypothetical protein
VLKSEADQAEPVRRGSRRLRPGRRRGAAAVAWAAGAIVVFALFLKVSVNYSMIADGANNALQAWDMLHGNPLLHGWILGDATFYTLELPLLAVSEALFGLHTIAVHVAEALVYLIVAACAVAIAVKDSRGSSRAARAAVVVAVLAAPALVRSDVWLPLGIPDHTGTTVFLLVSCLLIDRVTARRYTAPLLCLILCAGQISDVTVRYVAVPAIVVVCAYRMLADRKVATGDGANLLAAVLSVPLSLAVRKAMLHFGAYLMVAPATKLAPIRLWPHNAALTWFSLRELYGAHGAAGYRPAGPIAVFGYACMLATAAGILVAIWRWRTSRRADQVLLVAIAVNLAVYVVSTLPSVHTPHDMVAVLPCGAVLAARALVPERFTNRVTALAASGLALVAALLPLSLTAAHNPRTSEYASLITWLQAHRLSHGLGDYWDGSEVTLETGNQIQIRTVQVVHGRKITPYAWESDTAWYDPARHYANFILIDGPNHDLGLTVERIFGQPASTYSVDSWKVLVYRKNLLTDVKPAALPATS